MPRSCLKIVGAFFAFWLIFTLALPNAPSFLLIVRPAHALVPIVPVYDAFDDFYEIPEFAEETATTGGVLGILGEQIVKHAYDIAKDAVNTAWLFARQLLLNMLVNDVISWIQGGGTPRFITDFPGALENVGNQALGVFANELAGVNLCSDFRPAINLLIPKAKPFFEAQIACTASAITSNFERIWERDFGEGGGGWQNWLKVQEPQNNIFGAWLMADGALANRAAQLLEAKKLQIGADSGFIGQKECAEWSTLTQNPATGQMTPTGASIKKSYSGSVTMGSKKCDEASADIQAADDGFDADLSKERAAASDKGKKFTCYDLVDGQKRNQETFYEGAESTCIKDQVLTPGHIVGRAATKATADLDIDWLISADEIHKYLVAITDALINRVAREGLGLLRREAGSYTRSSAATFGPDAEYQAFGCDRITDAELKKECERSKEGVKPASEDPIQIILVERELLPQFILDIDNFEDDVVAYAEKLTALRGVQEQVRDKENGIADLAAKIVAAPRDMAPPVEGRVVTHEHEHGPGHHAPPESPFPPPPAAALHTHSHTHDHTLEFVLPVAGVQPAECTLDPPPPNGYPYDRFAAATRSPDQAEQHDGDDITSTAPRNKISESFSVTLQGLIETIAETTLDRIGAIASIGSAFTVNKTMTYTAEERICPNGDIGAKHIWSGAHTKTFTPEIQGKLDETLATLADVASQQGLIDDLLAKMRAYRALLDRLYYKAPPDTCPTGDFTTAGLGLQSGFPTQDDCILDKALEEIKKLRDPIIENLQALMDSSEPEFDNLRIEFTRFRNDIIQETLDVQQRTGLSDFPSAGGYYGQLLELDVVKQAIEGAAASCGPITIVQC